MSVTLPQEDTAWDQPATLADAHEELWHRRPAWDAEPRVWVEFHRYCARVYGQVSNVDVEHKSEALTCAGMEIRKARDTEHRLNPEDDDE